MNLELMVPDTSTWWKHRRRHSYWSLVGLFTQMLMAVWLPEPQLSVAMPLLQTLSWIFAAVILTYVGTATIEDVVKLLGARK